MHILADIRLLSRGGLSGIEEYTRRVIGGLITHGSEHTFTLFYNNLRAEPLPTAWTNADNVEILNWHVPNKLIDITSRFLHTPKIDATLHPDIIFSPHFNILESNRAPRIITFHDLSFIHHPDFFRIRQRLWHWLQNYTFHARHAEAIVTDSEFTKNDITKQFGVPEEKIHVVYPGVNPDMGVLDTDAPERKAFREKYSITYPFLLYLGTLEPRKNISAIIRAFSLLKQDARYTNLKLILAGKPGWLYTEILHTAKTSPHASDIIFWGPVKDAERKLLYNEAEAFVYPSFFEGFGFPPLEAQACGCPAVVGDRTSLPEIIKDTGIRINPWNVDELASALSSVLSDTNLRTRLIATGKENARRFTWGHTTKELLDIMQSLK